MSRFLLLLSMISILYPIPQGWAHLQNYSPKSSHSATSEVDYTRMTFDELLNIEIISVSKKPERLSDAGAAVSVITSEDIRRSGATSIQEALRLAPGVEVARENTHNWAISVRGFNSGYANKLLVLRDGRSVYTPIFSGVLWDVQDLLLEDIDRIEVIRGPGSTLWGANAVNGVINIITKSAQETQGGLATGAMGSHQYRRGGARYGGMTSDKLFYRLYAKAFSLDQLGTGKNQNTMDNTNAPSEMRIDNWGSQRSGFRLDWDKEPQNQMTLQGELYLNKDYIEIETQDFAGGDFFTEKDHSENKGGFILGQWKHSMFSEKDTALQLYYDFTERDSLQSKYHIRTIDLDFQQRFLIGDRHEITYGTGFRYVIDEIKNFNYIYFDPAKYHQDIFSAFIQDRIAILADVFQLTIGSKFEHNDFTAFETQPSCRFVWTPKNQLSFWGAISRAVRVPSRFDQHGIFIVEDRNITGNRNIDERLNILTINGQKSFDSEELTAYELGIRWRESNDLWIDIALFYNDYKGLQSFGDSDPVLLPDLPEAVGITGDFIVYPFVAENEVNGHTRGIELAADYRPYDWIRLRPVYAFLDMTLDKDDEGVRIFIGDQGEGFSPTHQYSLLTSINYEDQVEFDVWIRHVDALADLGIKAYTTFDLRLSYHFDPALEIFLVGQNLGQKEHTEFSSVTIERSFYAGFTYPF